jgi:PKD repeat protein
MSPRTRVLGVLLSVALLVSGWSGAARADQTIPNSLTAAVVGTVGTSVTGADQFSVGGDTPVKIAVARISNGTTKVVAGPDSSTRAVEFPAYVKSGTYPRAVVGLTATSGNALSPGSSDFEYGAVFRANTSPLSRSIDNGDNLFQRGLYGDPSQFKLEIDHGYPACLVRGSGGQVFASSSTPVVPNAWYHVTCTRIGSKVTVAFAPYGSIAAPVTATATGTAGTLSFPATTPASIGGKLNPSGTVLSSATDQFNGAVADVWVNRLPVAPPPNQPPVADAKASCTDLDCTFSAADSTDPESDPLTYAWDFADGSDPGSGVSTSHTYAAGSRTVTLTVSDNHGNFATDTVVATTTDPVDPGDPVDPPPTDLPPVAHATASCLELDCSFSAVDSSDPENEALTYSWDFADASSPGEGVETTHSYSSGAARTVTLTVTDDHANSSTDTVSATTTDPVIVDQSPVAHASASCTNLSCTFSAITSSDPENEALTYAWDYGDGTPAGAGVSTSHTYSSAASRTVTLTVRDDHGNSDTDTALATTTTPVTPIAYVAAAATNGNRTSHTVTVPTSVRAGDALLLFFSTNSTTPTYTNPAGWTVLESRNGDGTVVRAYRKVATATDAGSTVKVTSSAYVKSDLSVVAYRNTRASDPIAASASKADNVTGAAHTSPALTAVGSTGWLVTYWADKSTSTSAWTAPTGQSVRAKTFGTSSAHVSALLADSNGPVPAGVTGQKTATANSASTRGVSVSILLAGP